MTTRAGEDTDDERDLLLPRSRIDQLPGLEVLQVVVRDRGDVEDDGGGEKRESHQRLGRVRPDIRFHAEHQQQARRRSRPECRCQRAGCWMNRSGRPCNRRPPRRRSSSRRHRRRRRSRALSRASRVRSCLRSSRAPSRSAACKRNVTRPTMPIGMSRSVIGSVSACPGLARARRGHRAGQAARDRFHQLQQCPDCGNANRPGADEAHLVTPGALRECAGRSRQVAGERRVVRHEPAPANACADEHGDADGQSTEVTDREERERKREIITAHRAAPADAERLRHIGSEYLCRDDDRKNRGQRSIPTRPRADRRARVRHRRRSPCRRRCRP